MGTVECGSLGRWFEELCRIKYPRAGEFIAGNHRRLKPGTLPRAGGVYAFWWTGPSQQLLGPQGARTFKLAGPGGHEVGIRIDTDWLGLNTGLPIPLYVGKNFADIAKRVGWHLLLGHPGRVIPRDAAGHRRGAPTTSCQLRAGIEHLFPRVADPIELIVSSVGLSHVVLDGDRHAANRFYLEDLAIGLMRPPLNVDTER